MNLILDIGNTLTKAAIMSRGKVLKLTGSKVFSKKNLEELLKKFPETDKAIVSSVVKPPLEFIPFLKKKLAVLELNSKTNLPFSILYKNPETLGTDRIAAVAGALRLFPGRNVLVIDAGTCLKFNFINHKGEFSGGAISPGIEMRFRALHTFTGKLPLVKSKPFSKLVGQNTEESILAGVLNGIRSETEGIINEYHNKFSDLKVVLTGGDSPFFVRNLKNRIFARPNLILEGLNFILEHNIR